LPIYHTPAIIEKKEDVMAKDASRNSTNKKSGTAYGYEATKKENMPPIDSIARLMPERKEYSVQPHQKGGFQIIPGVFK
jgi:hypothetical protein